MFLPVFSIAEILKYKLALSRSQSGPEKVSACLPTRVVKLNILG